ncbi:MAG: MFS transporter, partial [Frisingicoccus sp.]
GLSSIIYMISSVVSSFVASLKWIEKKSSRFWIATIFTGLAAYCFLVPSVGYIPLILLLQLIPGLASGFLFSILTTKAMSEVPAEKKSTAMGFFQAVYAVGMSVFPILTGNIAEIGGMIASYRLMGVFALICVLAAVMLLRNAREG